VEGGVVTAMNKWTAEQREHPYDSVMMITFRASDCAIYDKLQANPGAMKEAGIKSIHLIGDAHTPGMIAQSTFSGARLAREFDTPDPDYHQPYIRERRLVDATEADYRLGAETLSMAVDF
jgi:dimethylamine/trimethylamine dehydrogenase